MFFCQNISNTYIIWKLLVVSVFVVTVVTVAFHRYCRFRLSVRGTFTIFTNAFSRAFREPMAATATAAGPRCRREKRHGWCSEARKPAACPEARRPAACLERPGTANTVSALPKDKLTAVTTVTAVQALTTL